MVFGLPNDEPQVRCSTWAEARDIHEKFVAEYIGNKPVDTKQYHEYYKAVTES